MRPRHILSAIVLLIIVLIGYSTIHKEPVSAVPQIVFEEPKDEETEIHPDDRQKLSELTRENAVSTVRIPRLDEYRQHALKDPHHTPKLLVDFAKTMSPNIELALKDEKQAERFWPTLSECTDDKNNSTIPAVVALCLSAADRISTKYPAFKDRFTKIKSSAGVEARKLYESSEIVD